VLHLEEKHMDERGSEKGHGGDRQFQMGAWWRGDWGGPEWGSAT
jgi:hypothetical protein